MNQRMFYSLSRSTWTKENTKRLVLLVRSDTLEPYFGGDPSETEEMFIELFGEKGEKIEIHDLKVINKEKIEDDKYEITMSINSTSYDGTTVMTEVETGNYTVVKIDGEWRIAEKGAGFESVFAIAGLLVVAYLLRRRN